MLFLLLKFELIFFSHLIFFRNTFDCLLREFRFQCAKESMAYTLV